MNTLRKVLELLTPKQRRALVGQFMLMLIGMAVETLSVGVVLPAISFFVQGNAPAAIDLPAPLARAIAGYSHTELVVYLAFGLFLVFVLKAAVLAFIAWRQADFMATIQADLSQRLFAGYLAQSWTFHLRRNSSELVRNAVTETAQFGQGAMFTGMTLITELLVILGVAALLLAVEPVGALLVMGVLGGVGTLFIMAVRPKLLRWGQSRQMYEAGKIQHLQQGLGGAKEVKLLGREREFLDQYWRHNRGSAQMLKRLNFTQALPRLWLEVLAVGGLVALILAMVLQGRPLTSLVPVLGLFATAAFRLIPSANRLFGAIQTIRYTLPVIDLLHAELRQGAAAAKPTGEQELTFSQGLELRHVCFSYESGRTALADISLTVPRGSSVGFIGGSGAGKSTLIDLIMGLLTPTSGVILADGRDIQDGLRSWQNRIGYVPQSIFLTDDTLRRNIAFGLPDDRIDDEAVRAAVAAAQLEEFVAALPEGLESVVGERGVRLSGGQRQRIGIARALYHDPDILVLDEATSALDTVTERGVMDAVRRLTGKTVLIVAHRHSTVEHCGLILRLENGEIVAHGAPQDMLVTDIP